MSLDQATLRALPNFPETLAEANPHLPSLDTDELARSRSYAAADAREVLAKFRRARAQTLDLLAGAADARIGGP